MSHIYDKQTEQCSCGWKIHSDSPVHWEEQYFKHLLCELIYLEVESVTTERGPGEQPDKPDSEWS